MLIISVMLRASDVDEDMESFRNKLDDRWHGALVVNSLSLKLKFKLTGLYTVSQFLCQRTLK